MSKYYAVKIGRQKGIYRDWEECEQQIDGFSGAVHKSFNTQEEAEIFCYGESTLKQTEVSNKERIEIYIDGSYDVSSNLGGYGCVIVKDFEVLTELSGVIELNEDDTSRNIYGEVRSALEAVKWAIKNEYKKVILFYDYEGIEFWAEGIWKAKRPVSIDYTKEITELKQNIEVEFKKVKAHSNDLLNDRVDALASQAIKNHKKFTKEKLYKEKRENRRP